MRAIQVRWGRRNLGFVWVFAEPLVFAFPVLAMWSVLRGPFDKGIPLIPFLWTGYLPILLFRHVTGSVIYIVRSNVAVMYHRAVTPLDIIITQITMETAGNVMAIVFSFFILYWMGILQPPYDLALFILGNIYMIWWCGSVALIVAAASEQTHVVEHAWPVLGYMYLPVSGFFFLAEWLPSSMRHWVLLVDPPLHAYEMIRGGMFGHQIHAYYNIAYVTYIFAGFTLIGLWLARDVRRHLELTE